MEHYLSRDFDEGLKQAVRREIDAMQKDAGTDFRLCVQDGDAAKIIAAVAEKDRADLVLIGRGALPHFAGRLRTHSLFQHEALQLAFQLAFNFSLSTCPSRPPTKVSSKLVPS